MISRSLNIHELPKQPLSMPNEPKNPDMSISGSSNTPTLTRQNSKKKKKKNASKNGSVGSGVQTPMTNSELTKSSNQKFTEEGATARSSTSTPPQSGGMLAVDPPAAQPSQAPNKVTPNPVGFIDDFIPFAASSDDDQDVTTNEGKLKSEKARGKEPAREVPPETERSFDHEKSGRRERSRDRDDGKKRKHDAIDLRDGFANKRQRMDAISRKAPWVYDIDWDDCRNVSEMLHREVKAFTEWISPSPVEDEVRELTVAIISRAITAAFPDAKVMPFGSYETKLYLPSGDIDLVIVSDSMAYSNKVSVLHSLAAVLRKAGITSSVTVISKAKVPIVKFVTTHGRFNVDISINQTNGVFGGQVVKGFLQSMGGDGIALRSLIFITKLFLGQRSMNEVFTGGLGSYSIVCLAISFLQLHPKIRRGEIDPEKNLGALVMEFFELYGCHFNYDQVGISVRDGGTYFNKRSRGWYDSNRRDCLSIEDPVDPSNDISSGSFGFPKVRAALEGAYRILTSTAYIRAAAINSKRQGRNFHLRDEFHPEDMGILSKAMGVTQETVNHRRLVREVYNKRVLHSILGVKPKAEVVVQEQPAETRRNQEPQKRPRLPRSPSPKERYSVWKELEGDDADILHDLRDTSRRNDHDPEESGKYDIGKQPPRKRRRKNTEEDKHTVFVVDDDDASLSEYGGIDGAGVSAHLVNGEGKSGKLSSRADAEKKRNYWLSKGNGLGEDSSDSVELL